MVEPPEVERVTGQQYDNYAQMAATDEATRKACGESGFVPFTLCA